MSDQMSLFVELSSEESAALNGGFWPPAPPASSGGTVTSSIGFDLGSYIFAIGAGTLFGNQGLTQAEIQKAWEIALVDSF